MGNRVYKSSTVNSVTTERKYIVDIVGKLPTILCELDADDNDSLTNEYVYVHDRLGSVRLVAGYDGGDFFTNNLYMYKPFGNPFTGNTTETVYNPFQFTGQWLDVEIDQYYLRARMYDPTMMRFTTRDPVFGKLKDPLTLHKYLYCVNEPINRIDPTGRSYAILEPIMAGHSVNPFAIAVTATGVANSNWNIISYGVALQRTILPVMAIVMVANRGNSPRQMQWEQDEIAAGNYMGGGGPGWWDRLPKWAKISTGIVVLTANPFVVQGIFELGEIVADWIFGDSDNEYPEEDVPPEVGPAP